MSWSRGQQVALAMLPKFSSFFTFLGSAWIIIEVSTSTTKRVHPYHRLIFAMSIYDILEAVWNFMSTWPIPKDKANENQVWAMGTQGTCSAQGFFLTIAVAVPIYNAFLALYYMLVVNYNLRDRTLRRIVEPTMHAIAFIWAFGTATVSLGLGLINNANLWCWIAPYPGGCLDSWRYGDEGNCIRGDNYWIYRWAFYFAPLWFCILVATICTFSVYRRVKSLDKRTLRYRRPENSDFSFSEEDDDRRRHSGLRSSIIQRLSFRRSSSEPRIELDLVLEEQKDDEFLNGRDDASFSSNLSRQSLIDHWKSQRAIYKEDYSRTVEVSQQAIWYMTAFYLTHVWSTTTRIIQQINNGKTYVQITLIHSWFDPFQGFLNFIVYQRPRYLKIRKAYPSINRYQVICKTLRFSYLPTPKVKATLESFSGIRRDSAADNVVTTVSFNNENRIRRVSFLEDVSNSRQSGAAIDQGGKDDQCEEVPGDDRDRTAQGKEEKQFKEELVTDNDSTTQAESKKRFHNERVDL